MYHPERKVLFVLHEHMAWQYKRVLSLSRVFSETRDYSLIDDARREMANVPSNDWIGDARGYVRMRTGGAELSEPTRHNDYVRVTKNGEAVPGDWPTMACTTPDFSIDCTLRTRSRVISRYAEANRFLETYGIKATGSPMSSLADMWLVGGGANPRESAYDTVVRELYEETGLTESAIIYDASLFNHDDEGEPVDCEHTAHFDMDIKSQLKGDHRATVIITTIDRAPPRTCGPEGHLIGIPVDMFCLWAYGLRDSQDRTFMVAVGDMALRFQREYHDMHGESGVDI